MYWWLQGFVWILPALIANMAPVLTAGIVEPLMRPIDGGARAPDGRRWLGDGKTWNGLAAAVVFGALTGGVLGFFGESSLAEGAFLGFAAILGDLAGSFTKRRLGMARGSNAGLLDSLDFIIFALLAALPFHPWELRQLLLVVVLVPLLHRAANILGYKMKLKDVPW